jgi:hypothetical protein
VVIAEVGEGVFKLDLVGDNQVPDFGGRCHGLNGLIPPEHHFFLTLNIIELVEASMT